MFEFGSRRSLDQSSPKHLPDVHLESQGGQRPRLEQIGRTEAGSEEDRKGPRKVRWSWVEIDGIASKHTSPGFGERSKKSWGVYFLWKW